MNPIKYFAFFKYVPTVEEYQRFAHSLTLPKKYRVLKGRVVGPLNKHFLSSTLRKAKISQAKIAKRQFILRLLSCIPTVKYLGISGSVSMLNATAKDDLDLFVITKAGRLWSCRFWLVVLTTLFRVRRRRLEKKTADKLCLNLFFSEENLKIPKFKQTEYIAHEILQLKTIVNKEQTYERLLAANQWVFKLFPQAKPPKYPIAKRVGPLFRASWGEKLLKQLQMWLINRHKTNEIITDTQLWFFPKDFEKRFAKSS